MFSDGADLTSLMALNIPIEPAYGGDSVDYAEALHGRTGATEEIVQQIEEIRAATKEAMASMAEIGQAVRDMEEISAVIAAVMADQELAVGELSGQGLETGSKR